MTNNPRKNQQNIRNTKETAPPYNKKCRNQKTQSKGHFILQPELEYAWTQINSQHSQQQIERHVSEFMKLNITIW